MKLTSGIITLLLAIIISGVAAYFSVVGLAALFAATFLPVIIMGASLEAGKLTAAQWLKSNWHNPKVNALHKVYLLSAILALMIITALGIYGFLSKGHLEQSAPVAGIELQITQKQQSIVVLESQNKRLYDRIAQMDASLDVFLKNDRATLAVQERNKQKTERKQYEQEIDTNYERITSINNEIMPLRLQASEVEAKLGPVKYVADLLGLDDPEAAVRVIILILMFAFDPLAIVLLLSSTITLSDYVKERRERKQRKELDNQSREQSSRQLPTIPTNTETTNSDRGLTDQELEFISKLISSKLEETTPDIKVDTKPKKRRTTKPKVETPSKESSTMSTPTEPSVPSIFVDLPFSKEVNDKDYVEFTIGADTEIANEDPSTLEVTQQTNDDDSEEDRTNSSIPRDNSWLSKPKPGNT